MQRNLRSISVLLALTAVILLPACESGKDMQIAELQQQVDDLRFQRSDLESRLAAALNGGDQARQMALSLQQQLDEARRQLAEGEAQPGNLPEGWEGTGQIAWVPLAGDLLFDSGKAKLKAGGAETVAAVARQINESFPNRQIFVIGHTDTDPIKVTKNLWDDNLDLSANRAMTVARELQKLGVDASRIIAGGQGEYNPRAPNDEANKAQNRRVEIIAVERQ
ncbi:MAG: OmpA family protein [Planctomycetes bacterium]|nr:OmpA family protein [Planctomycetota bacterium]